MASEIKYDVHGKVGVAFIFGCLFIGIVIAGILPFLADQVGMLRLGIMTQADHRVEFKNVQFFGIVGGIFGLINGIALSIRFELWKLGLLLIVIPCGCFGLFAGRMTPHPFSPVGTSLTFLVIPLVISGVCIQVRRRVWARYQQPVRKTSDKS